MIDLVACDALALPFADESFDATMVAFGIRNFADRAASLLEMKRVLKPSGLCLILELSKPNAPIIAQLYAVYARTILPLLGKMISKHNEAYAYLPDSIAKFPERKEFGKLMEYVGFGELRIVPLTFGAATIYLGRRS